MDLVTWNENLRVWLTQTIFKPLVSEIERVNSTLPRLGVSDVSVGSVPVERLRKVSTLPQVSVVRVLSSVVSVLSSVLSVLSSILSVLSSVLRGILVFYVY